MEYVDGTSLRKYIDLSGSLNVNEAIYYFRLLLEAIRELHSFRGKIIHRDLKPENILLTKDLRNIKLIDFGISSVIETINDKAKEVYTNENVLYGTYPYICPDLLKLKSVPPQQRQEMARQIITVQFDFFSLGVIFYEMLTGEKPFYAENYDDVNVIGLPLKYDIISMHDINPNIHVALENIIFRCLASKPEDVKYRYSSIDQIISDLERYEKKPLSFVNAKLLKPKNRRVLPIKRTFNVEMQKTKEKFYVKK
jgi:serine/threonine-protein kinase